MESKKYQQYIVLYQSGLLVPMSREHMEAKYAESNMAAQGSHETKIVIYKGYIEKTSLVFLIRRLNLYKKENGKIK